MIGWAVLAGVGAFCTAAAATVYGYLQDRRHQRQAAQARVEARIAALADPRNDRIYIPESDPLWPNLWDRRLDIHGADLWPYPAPSSDMQILPGGDIKFVRVMFHSDGTSTEDDGADWLYESTVDQELEQR